MIDVLNDLKPYNNKCCPLVEVTVNVLPPCHDILDRISDITHFRIHDSFYGLIHQLINNYSCSQ